jgi:hypothetical protein
MDCATLYTEIALFEGEFDSVVEVAVDVSDIENVM